MVKLDASGSVIWQKTYGGMNNDRANSVAPTPDGGYILAGDTGSYGSGNYDGWVLKLDASGNIITQTALGAIAMGSVDGFNSAVPTKDGGYVVAGFTQTFNSDGWILKLDATGNVQGQKTYGGMDYDEVRAIARTSDGGYIATGVTWSFGAGGSDAWVLKLDPKGDLGKNCSIIGTSSAIVTTTSAAAVDSTATVVDTTVPGVDTNATVMDSQAQIATQCPN